MTKKWNRIEYWNTQETMKMLNEDIDENLAGKEAYKLIKELWPINRSLSGKGVRQTLKIIKRVVGSRLKEKSVKSGKRCFDWTVPNEWDIREAWIKDEKGDKVIDFKENNLHIVGYSDNIETRLDLKELKKYIYTASELPNAIPYVTSYYKKRWGMCMSKNQLDSLKEGYYDILIDSTFKPGKLDYGEIVIPGRKKKEILFSTYICHPSMANNELSGPAVACQLINWIQGMKSKQLYTYRFLFLQETIGSIAYLSRHHKRCKKNIIAGYVLTCVGDERTYSYLPSRDGNTLSDKAAKQALKQKRIKYKEYTWLDRGSDERQYCSPGIDLPIASIMRSKYGEYPEYHTSEDNLELVTEKGLQGTINIYKDIIKIIEGNRNIEGRIKCEPQLGRRGLYPTTSTTNSHNDELRLIETILTYADSRHDLIDIATILEVDFEKIKEKANILERNNLVKLTS